ncbi:MAG: hypothetical protein E6G15_04035 [Actinobacteria bacterium]|nr:MAG: hypothetical protein E6G15_04035 [Actinomycetota bacterium]
MKRHLFYLGLVALAVLTVGTSSSLAARQSGTIGYVFNGQLLADAGNSPSLFVDVHGGNKPALRKLIGQGRTQQFAVDAGTQYIRWTDGQPALVNEASLVAGDFVTIRVRAARDASLGQIESTPAWRVADRGANNGHPRRPLWLFIGTLNAPAAGGHFSLHITNGNLLALRKMLGAPLDETFTYDSHTIFVLWQHGVPTVIQPGQMVVGDRISVRIRAPRRDSLGQAEAVPANHVGDHEPGTS